jgi:hypothetical protein
MALLPPCTVARSVPGVRHGPLVRACLRTRGARDAGHRSLRSGLASPRHRGCDRGGSSPSRRASRIGVHRHRGDRPAQRARPAPRRGRGPERIHHRRQRGGTAAGSTPSAYGARPAARVRPAASSWWSCRRRPAGRRPAGRRPAGRRPAGRRPSGRRPSGGLSDGRPSATLRAGRRRAEANGPIAVGRVSARALGRRPEPRLGAFDGTGTRTTLVAAISMVMRRRGRIHGCHDPNPAPERALGSPRSPTDDARPAPMPTYGMSTETDGVQGGSWPRTGR